MTATEALTRLGETTAEAACKVLERFAPRAVQLGDLSVVTPGAEPLADFPAPYVATTVHVDGTPGGTVLVLTLAGAKRLAAAMMGMDPPAAGQEVAELDEVELSAVSEAMGQALDAAAAATGEVLGTEVETTPAETRLVAAGETAPGLCPPSSHASATALSVLGEPARLVQLVPNAFTARMTRAPDDLGIEATVREAGPGRPRLSGITMRLTAELGRARMPAGRAVGLPAGAVIELDAEVDSPIDVFVNGVRFATGRLLVTDEGDWAVQVTDVVALAAPDSATARS